MSCRCLQDILVNLSSSKKVNSSSQLHRLMTYFQRLYRARWAWDSRVCGLGVAWRLSAMEVALIALKRSVCWHCQTLALPSVSRAASLRNTGNGLFSSTSSSLDERLIKAKVYVGVIAKAYANSTIERRGRWVIRKPVFAR